MPRRGYKECPFCAEIIREKAKLCRFCGRSMEDSAVAPPPPAYAPPAAAAPTGELSLSIGQEGPAARIEALGLHLSAGHQQRLRSFLSAPDDQYRTATVLFADICGYTRMCEELRAEEVKEILDVYYAICAETVDAFNGSVLEFQGDGCLAVFGVPIGFDRDAESAVRAAWDIRERVRAAFGGRIEISAGVESGDVLSSRITAQNPPTLKVFGAAVNLAARIESAAQANQILIGPGTFELVERVFVLRPQPAREFKNVQGAVITYLVEGIRSADLERRDFTAPFFGRMGERRRLEEAWGSFVTGAAAGKGKCAGIVITGDPGIGKSRLVAEFARARGTGDVPVAGGRAGVRQVWIEGAPHDVKIPWGLWRAVLGAVAGAAAGGSAEERVVKLAALLDSLGAGAELRQTCMALAGDTRAARELAGMPPQLLRRLFASDLRNLLERAAEASTILLVLDDVQWADRSSLEVLDAILEWPPAGVFFTIVHRTGFSPKLSRLKAMPRMHIYGLDAPARNELFGVLAGGQDILPELRDALLERAEGNPLYMVELSRLLGQAASAGQQDGEIVPLTLKEMLQSRIDMLDQRRRLVLQCGAVLGRRFAVQIIQLFEFIREGLLARLYSLASAELLADDASHGELEFLFRHHMTREVAYQALPDRKRRELHRLVAERLEEKFADDLAARAPLLAYHYARAGEHAKAARHLCAAGDQAAELAAASEAIEFYTQAAGSLGKCPPTPETRLQHARALRWRGRMQRLLGDNSGAMESFELALELADESAPESTSLAVRQEISTQHMLAGEYGKAEEGLRALQKMPGLKKEPVLEAQTWTGLGACAWGRGDFREARQRFERALELSGATHNPSLSADVRNNLGLIAWKEGNLRQALELFQAAMLLRRKGKDRFGIALTLKNMAIIEENMGRFVRAEKHYREALALDEQNHFVAEEGAVRSNLANLCLTLGRAAEAAEHAAQAFDAAQRAGDPRGAAIALENLALAHLLMSRFVDCEKQLREARAVARKLGDAERDFSLDLVRIEMLLAQGKAKTAEPHLKKAMARLEDAGFGAERPRLFRLVAAAKLGAGLKMQGQEALARALAEAERQGNESEKRQIERLAAVAADEK